MYITQHCFIFLPSDSTVSEDAVIEPRTVATKALAVRRSYHSAVDLIHKLDLVHFTDANCSIEAYNSRGKGERRGTYIFYMVFCSL
jgi:hypothetical protein